MWMQALSCLWLHLSGHFQPVLNTLATPGLSVFIRTCDTALFAHSLLSCKLSWDKRECLSVSQCSQTAIAYFLPDFELVSASLLQPDCNSLFYCRAYFVGCAGKCIGSAVLFGLSTSWHLWNIPKWSSHMTSAHLHCSLYVSSRKKMEHVTLNFQTRRWLMCGQIKKPVSKLLLFVDKITALPLLGKH